MLRASIQTPIQRQASLDIILAAVADLGKTYLSALGSVSSPFGFQLTPKGDHFLSEIIVPLNNRREILRALNLLVALDVIFLRGNKMSPLYESGIRYGFPGKLAWYTAPILYRKKKGDCKDLACLRVAELHLLGEKGAQVDLLQVNPRLWHVRVKRANGTIEDPSKRLGMGAPKRKKKKVLGASTVLRPVSAPNRRRAA